MHERFIRDGSSVRLGNLASDLLRLNKWILMRHKDEAIVDLMREIAWLMEWSGDLALAELADMQREICRWRRAWPIEQARHILALRAFSRCRTGFWHGQGFLNRRHPKQNKPLEAYLFIL